MYVIVPGVSVTDNFLAVAQKFPRPRLDCFACSQNTSPAFDPWT